MRYRSDRLRNHRGETLFTAVIVLLAAAIVGLVLLRVVRGPGGAEDSRPSRTTAEATHASSSQAPGRLDPAPYRSLIEQLESRLYAEAPPDVGAGDVIGDRIRQLAGAVIERETAPRGRRAGRELLAFAASLGAREDVGYGTIDLPGARTRWEALRNDVFAAADWFRGSSAALADVQTAAAPDIPPGAVRALTDVATDMDRLVRNGRREALRFKEPGVDVQPDSREGRELAERWQRWAGTWPSRVTGAMYVMPRLATNMHLELVNAARELERVARRLVELSEATGSSGVPGRSDRTHYFDTAEAMLTRAWDALRAVQAEMGG